MLMAHQLIDKSHTEVAKYLQHISRITLWFKAKDYTMNADYLGKHMLPVGKISNIVWQSNTPNIETIILETINFCRLFVLN